MTRGVKVGRSIRFGLLLTLGLCGCGGDTGPRKVPVSGTVMLDGQPVPQGQIVLSDAAGKAASIGGDIKEGRFSLKSTIGKKTVSISSIQVIPGKKSRFGGTQGDPVSEENPAHVYEEVVPPQYNAKTNLTMDVSEAGPNEFPFQLTTK